MGNVTTRARTARPSAARSRRRGGIAAIDWAWIRPRWRGWRRRRACRRRRGRRCPPGPNRPGGHEHRASGGRGVVHAEEGASIRREVEHRRPSILVAQHGPLESPGWIAQVGRSVVDASSGFIDEEGEPAGPLRRIDALARAKAQAYRAAAAGADRGGPSAGARAPSTAATAELARRPDWRSSAPCRPRRVSRSNLAEVAVAVSRRPGKSRPSHSRRRRRPVRFPPIRPRCSRRSDADWPAKTVSMIGVFSSGSPRTGPATRTLWLGVGEAVRPGRGRSERFRDQTKPSPRPPHLIFSHLVSPSWPVTQVPEIASPRRRSPKTVDKATPVALLTRTRRVAYSVTAAAAARRRRRAMHQGEGENRHACRRRHHRYGQKCGPFHNRGGARPSCSRLNDLEGRRSVHLNRFWRHRPARGRRRGARGLAKLLGARRDTSARPLDSVPARLAGSPPAVRQAARRTPGRTWRRFDSPRRRQDRASSSSTGRCRCSPPRRPALAAEARVRLPGRATTFAGRFRRRSGEGSQEDRRARSSPRQPVAGQLGKAASRKTGQILLE